MDEWGCRLYGSVGNLLTFVSFCDKNMGVQVICSAGYSPENTVCTLYTLNCLNNSYCTICDFYVQNYLQCSSWAKRRECCTMSFFSAPLVFFGSAPMFSHHRPFWWLLTMKNCYKMQRSFAFHLIFFIFLCRIEQSSAVNQSHDVTSIIATASFLNGSLFTFLIIIIHIN